MKRSYCYVCGSNLKQRDERRWFCPTCEQDYYDNPRPCSDLVIFNQKGEVLLCERAIDPGKGDWDLPGGFIEYNETAEEAALREAAEELNITSRDITHPKYVMTYASDYPWGRETYKIMSVVFVVRAKKELDITPLDDVADVKWVKPDDISVSELSVAKFKDYIHKAYDILET